ncbi:hypothetical protein [Nocardia blacklockiae]|uniref:hypothetical protein n=1 Tax=Nocardia blacklockiae TaxID=480036 RepID=UPI0018941746|nr:hypothetical protein [Nocardia blacklockiae]MBF6173685.1 hypothetical protein [Nocardia blacklockiae]
MIAENHRGATALALAALTSLALCGPAAAEPVDAPSISGDSPRSNGAPDAVRDVLGWTGSADPEPGNAGARSADDGTELRITGSAESGPSRSAGQRFGGAPDEVPLISSTADPPAVVRPPSETRDYAAAPTAALGLDTGSVAAACTGSALVGGSALVLGSAAGSGVPGLIGTGSGGSAGSSLVPGLVGTGSGSGVGSSAVGSAMTGSALLTCLLLLPTGPPPEPEQPLRLRPPEPPHAVTPAPPVAIARNATPPISESEPDAEPPRHEARAAAQQPEPHNAWNTVIMMTMLVTVIVAASARGRASIRRGYH